MYHKSKGYKIFSFFNYIFLILIALSCFLPMLHLLAQSLSSKAAINGNLVSFWPVDFNADAYVKTFKNSNFTGSMQVSVFRTVLGTLISMFIITTAGYALSKDFRGRNALMWVFIFTMLFSGINSVLYPGHEAWIKRYDLVLGASGCLWRVQFDSDHEFLQDHSEGAGRSRVYRRSFVLRDFPQNLPAAVASRLGHCGIVHHGRALERLV